MQSDKIDLLAQALWKAQKEMGKVRKDSNNVIFGSHYVTLKEVQRVIEKPLEDNDLVVTQGGSNGSIFTQVTHYPSGQWMRSELSLPASVVDPQKIGSAITYFRRYGLAAMLNLEQEDDDGNSAAERDANDPAKNGQKEGAHSTQKGGKERAKEIADLIKAGYIKKETYEASLKACKVKTLTDLPKDEAQSLINHGLDNKTIAEQGA